MMNSDMNHDMALNRVERLLGGDTLSKIQHAKIIIFGVGVLALGRPRLLCAPV